MGRQGLLRRRPSAPSTYRVTIVDKGGLRRTPPSAAIRVHRRARNSTGSGLDFTRVSAEDYAARESARPDTLLVVRDAVPSTCVDALVARATDEGTRVVVDLDDDLVTDEARARLGDQGYALDQLDALAGILRRADQVIVSTGHLADLVGPLRPGRVSVVPNELDPLLWFDADPAAPDLEVGEDAELRLLYMGSSTHADDLCLLDGLPERLTARLARPVVIEVVGITASDLPPGTRRLLPLKTHYPGFVAWLRRNQARWSVGLAPLVDERFNHAKSDLKLLEYAALGLPVVASPVGPYRLGGSGGLAATAATPDQWVDAVAHALSQGRSARDLVRRDRTMTPESLESWRGLLRGPSAAAG